MLNNITELIKCSKRNGEEAQRAKEMLFNIFYDELHKIAKARMSRERPNHTLQPTALINEAYIKFIENKVYEGLENRVHFFATASKIMRNILVDYARTHKSQKRGGKEEKILINEEIDGQSEQGLDLVDLIALGDALNELEKSNKLRCEIVDMKVFGGLQNEEIAKVHGISSIKVKAQWNLARNWLRKKLQNEQA